ncbi:MAG TPA: aldose epimerase family protein, partial [Aestuariivirgaceae bacterium]|nr:aldose epimerase family protein [Aestuariivirgaceae bacterium]
MSIEVERFGTYRGTPVEAFTLANRRGMRARVMSYGACLVGFEVPDARGRTADVVLGFDSLEPYLDDPAYFGMTCGRMVNRIRNAQFELDGETFKVTRNWRQHQLHGGVDSFSRRLWEARPDDRRNAVVFSLTSADGEEGYPGTVRSRTTYALDENGLTITMEAETDRPTVVNQAHHSYWNLAGHGSGDILEHVVSVAADNYTPGDEDLIPTGSIEPVAGTPYDLRRPRPLREHFNELAREGEHNGY